MSRHKGNAEQQTSLYKEKVELYDIAFDWDIDQEVTWLLDRLGSQCRIILEPGCGSGRVLKAFAQRGIEIVGLDSSHEGIAFAKQRIAALPSASAFVADIIKFDLTRSFDGAICPINTLAILSPEELAQHLNCMSRHLRFGARYLVQVALRESNRSDEKNEKGIEWKAERGDMKLRIKVWVDHTDYQNMRELHGFKITVESGACAGEVFLEKHWMTMWTHESWHKIISSSSFRQIAQYDGDYLMRPSVPIGKAGNLMWHELVRRER